MIAEPIRRRFVAGGVTAAKAATARRPGDSIATVQGYAATFGVISTDLGGWAEKIEPGAFSQVLREGKHPVLALYDHAVANLLGSTVAGTLRLTEDSVGLRFELQLPNTTLGRDCLALVERGDLAGCSFGFTVNPKQTVWQRSGGKVLNIVKQVSSLREISLVCLPAYSQSGITTVSATPPRADTPTQARARAAVAKMMQAAAAAG